MAIHNGDVGCVTAALADGPDQPWSVRAKAVEVHTEELLWAEVRARAKYGEWDLALSFG